MTTTPGPVGAPTAGAPTLEAISAASASCDFRAYVADLAAYNNGILRGAWIGLDGLTAEEITTAVQAVVGAEEYAIHDWDGVPTTFGEWPDWDAVAAYTAAMADLDEPEQEAFNAFLNNTGDSASADTLEAFRDAYRGCYSCGEQYAEELANELGDIGADYGSRWPLSCIDWDAAWRELELGGDNWSHWGSHGLHVFSNY
jgi:antirestriction protein